MDPQSKDEVLTHHSGGMHGDVEPSGDDLPSSRVLGRTPEPSRSRVDDDGGDGTFLGIMIGYLGFSDEGVYMGGGLTPGEPCGPHTTSPRTRRWTRAARWCGGSTTPSVSPSVSMYVTAIYDGGFSSRDIPRIFPV